MSGSLASAPVPRAPRHTWRSMVTQWLVLPSCTRSPQTSPTRSPAQAGYMIYDRMIRLMPSGSQDGIYDISYKMYRCAVGAISVLFLVRLLKYDKYMPQSYCNTLPALLRVGIFACSQMDRYGPSMSRWLGYFTGVGYHGITITCTMVNYHGNGNPW